MLLRTDLLNVSPVNDPVAATVFADTGAVDTVIVAGRIRKRGGRLLADTGKVLDAARASAERVGARG